MSEYDLEVDLRNSKVIRKLVKSDKFAQNLYAALCNVEWQHKKEQTKWWSCSWRAAGEILSYLTEKSSYMDYYCSGIGASKTDKGYVPEGKITSEIKTILASLGWTKHK